MTKAQKPGEVFVPTFEDYTKLATANDAKLEKLKQVQSDLRVIVGAVNATIAALSEAPTGPDYATATLIAKIRDSVMDVANSTTNICMCDRDIQRQHDPITQQLISELKRARKHITKLNDRLAMINTSVKINFPRTNPTAKLITDIVEGLKDKKE